MNVQIGSRCYSATTEQELIALLEWLAQAQKKQQTAA